MESLVVAARRAVTVVQDGVVIASQGFWKGSQLV
jgi:hypothetical protein